MNPLFVSIFSSRIRAKRAGVLALFCAGVRGVGGGVTSGFARLSSACGAVFRLALRASAKNSRLPHFQSPVSASPPPPRSPRVDAFAPAHLALSGSLREFDSQFSTTHPCWAAYAVFLGYRLDSRAASQAAWVA